MQRVRVHLALYGGSETQDGSSEAHDVGSETHSTWKGLVVDSWFASLLVHVSKIAALCVACQACCSVFMHSRI